MARAWTRAIFVAPRVRANQPDASLLAHPSVMESLSTIALRMKRAGAWRLCAGALLTTVLCRPALATEAPEATHKAETAAAKPEAPAVVAAPVEPPMTEAQASVRKYCMNIAAAATDARFAWQSRKLLEVETRIKARVAELDAKQAELKAWLDHREQMAREARDNLVGIYGKMKPETAAAQISALNDETAAAVLAALTPRQASAIFNEMTPPDRAAKLAGLMSAPAAASDKKL